VRRRAPECGVVVSVSAAGRQYLRSHDHPPTV